MEAYEIANLVPVGLFCADAVVHHSPDYVHVGGAVFLCSGDVRVRRGSQADLSRRQR